MTKTKFPPGTNTIQTYDNTEFVVIGKYQIAKEKVKQYVETYNFRPYISYAEYQKSWLKDSNMRFADVFMGLPMMDALQSKSGVNPAKIANSRDFKVLTGCSPDNTWSFLLNVKTGELWVEVMYPDMAGDSPSNCK
ncbi:MAG: hypothetical protein AAF518_15205 [Spirochaetota bacterium]